MASAKTAISLPPKLLKKVDQYAKRERLSRSGFFALAAERLLKEVEGSEITHRINAVLDAIPETTAERRDRELFHRSSSRTLLRLTRDDKW